MAAKLTGWRIDIKSLPEAASDSLHKLQSDPEYAFMRDNELSVISQIELILAKKAESRPVTPEEYQILAQFVDRVERGIIRRRESERKVEDARIKEARSTIPDAAFQISLVDLPLSNRLFELLTGSGYDTVGSLMLQLKLDPDEILAIGGVGPKAMDEIKSILSTLEFPQPVEEMAVEEPELVIESEVLVEPLIVEVPEIDTAEPKVAEEIAVETSPDKEIEEKALELAGVEIVEPEPLLEILNPEFIELTQRLDPCAFWEENKTCQAFTTAKPRCSLSFSPDDHWLFEFFSVPSTLHFYQEKSYRDQLHRQANQILREYIGMAYFDEDTWEYAPRRIENLFGCWYTYSEGSTPWLTPTTDDPDEFAHLLDQAEAIHLHTWALPEEYLREWETRKASGKPLPLLGGGSRGPATIITSVLKPETAFYWLLRPSSPHAAFLRAAGRKDG